MLYILGCATLLAIFFYSRPAQDAAMSQPLPNKNLPMPSLRNIQAFIEVAATGSLNLAAENLNITASAVSHQIASLEHFLGKKLFSRSSKGVTLTAVGEKYLKEVSGALNMIGQPPAR